MTHRPVPDGALLVTVDASWFPGRPPTGPTSFLATASGLADAHESHEIDPSGRDRPSVGRPGDARVDLTDHGWREPVHLPGTLLPPFTDAHVHLGLVDATELVPHGIAAVHDLGWIPEVAAEWAREGDREARAEGARPVRPGRRMPRVAFAGAFLTEPGGYPSDRSWAPDGSVEEVASPVEAVAAVDRQLAAGASFVKVALNSAAGPVPDDVTLAAIVGRAHERGRGVVAHAEGPGQVARAFEAGVDRLAHAPFSERLPDELITAMARPSSRALLGPRPLADVEHDPARRRARPEGRNEPQNDSHVVFGAEPVSRMSWVSTLDIHGWGTPTPAQDVAIDNVRRFAAAGGSVVYGTDLGNGPLPVGVNERELRALAAAGLGGDDLLRALTSDTVGQPCAERRTADRVMHSDVHHSCASAALGAVTYVPGLPVESLAELDRLDRPDALADLTRWLAGATTLHLADVLRPGFTPPSGTTTRKDQT